MTGSVTTLGRRARRGRSIAARAVLHGLEGVVAAAEPSWPVASGRSKAALAAEPTTEGARIPEPAPYARFIVSHGRHPWNDLVVVPVGRLASGALLDDIGDRLIADLARDGG